MSCVIIFDIGATNVRCVAVSETGEILGQQSMPNETSADPHHPGGRIWDLDLIWSKLVRNCRALLASLPSSPDIRAVTVTTFGVDGAPLDKNGNLLYPVISWACERTVPVLKELTASGFTERAYGLNGLQAMHYNTVSKIAWMKQNHPEIIGQTSAWVLMPSLIVRKLSGETVTDTSMAGTSMLTDSSTRAFSSELFSLLGIPSGIFPALSEPGTRAGSVRNDAAEETGLPVGTPVILTGHDTQFAVFGSGVESDRPVLSSGTWEILFGRTTSFPRTDGFMVQGLTSELDPIPGYFHTGVQWIASGAVEWLRALLFSGEKDSGAAYAAMVAEAEASGPGANWVFCHPAFFSGIGPSAPYSTKGTFLGLTIKTTRGDMVRALYEALAFQACQALSILETACGFKAASLVCSGGGAKNPLWNRLRADISGIPLLIPERIESTALGAAMFAFAGAGVYPNAVTARESMKGPFRTVEPGPEAPRYAEGMARFLSLAPGLKGFYA
jgi:L-fuculokinase